MKLHKIFEKYIKTIEIELLRVQKLLTNSVSEDKYQLIKANRPIYYFIGLSHYVCATKPFAAPINRFNLIDMVQTKAIKIQPNFRFICLCVCAAPFIAETQYNMQIIVHRFLLQRFVQYSSQSITNVYAMTLNTKTPESICVRNAKLLCLCLCLYERID